MSPSPQQSGRPLPLRFVLSAPNMGHLPDARAEIALVGRSNVGKSSVLNALGNNKKLAAVAKTPGRTRLLNCFAVDGTDAAIIDCPGYGYASASKAMRAGWAGMMEEYLGRREQLAMVAVLVDGEIGPTKLDVEMLQWLRAEGRPHAVVASKHDKVKSSQREKRKRDLAAGCDLLPTDPIWVSAIKGTGVDRLRDIVRVWLGLV